MGRENYNILMVFVLLSIALPLKSQDVFLVENAAPSYSVIIKMNLNTCDTNSIFKCSRVYADIAFSSDSLCWGIGGTGDRLYKINFKTDEETFVVELPSEGIANMNALTADGQYLYASGHDLILYDYINGEIHHKGLLPDHMIANGDLTFYNGKLYQTGGLGYLIEININHPEESIIIDTLPGDNGFYSGIVTYNYSCDSSLLYLFGNTEGVNSYNFKTRNINNVCDRDLWILGAATYNEHLSASCNLSIDLDRDNSTRHGLNFEPIAFCDFEKIPICDTDLIINSTLKLDSVQLILHQPSTLPDSPKEYLTSDVKPDLYLRGDSTSRITLINKGRATQEDFINTLYNTYYQNEKPIPTFGMREVLVIPYSGDQTGDTAVAFLPIIPPQEIAGRDTSIQVCSSVPSLDLKDMLGSQATSTGIWLNLPEPGSTIFNPSLHKSDTFAYIAQDPFCPDTAFISIIVTDQLGLDLGEDTTLCGNQTLLLDPGLPISGSYSWHDRSSASTYLVDQEGVYWLEYTSDNGCSARDSIIVFYKEPNRSDTVRIELCSGQNYQFNGKELSDSGVYFDTIPTAGCDSITILELEVNPTPDFHISGDSVLCNNSNGQLTIAGNFEFYVWNTGESTSQITIDTGGWYVSIITDQNGCVGYDSIYVEESNLTELQYTPQRPVCHGESSGAILLESIRGGTPPYVVYLNGQEYITEQNQITGIPAGEHLLKVIDSFGCSIEETITIEEAEDWQLTLSSPTQQITPGNTVNLGIKTSLDSIFNFEWIASDPFISTNTKEAKISPTKSQWIYVYLKDQSGCKRSDSTYLKIDDTYSIYAPNVFTPDKDNINDTWRVYWSNGAIQELQITIYDRWGNLIFECHGLDCSWDGKINEVEVVEGVYIYQIRYKKYNGNEWFYKSGSVTLIK